MRRTGVFTPFSKAYLAINRLKNSDLLSHWFSVKKNKGDVMKITLRRHTSLNYKDGIRFRKWRWDACTNGHGFERYADYLVLTISYKYTVLCWSFYPEIMATLMPTLKGEKI